MNIKSLFYIMVLIFSIPLSLPARSQSAAEGWYVFSGYGEAAYEPDRYKACMIMLQNAGARVYPYYHPPDGENRLLYSYNGPSTLRNETSLFCVHINIRPDGSDNGTYYFMESNWRCRGQGDFVPQNMSCGITPNNRIDARKNFCEASSNQKVGDPINLATSGLEEERVDFNMFSQQPFVIKRLYRSQSLPGKLLGDGKWKFDFEYVLTVNGNSLYLNSPYGEVFEFTTQSSGNYIVSDKQGPISVTKGEQSYDIVLSDGTKLNFTQNDGREYRIRTVERRGGLVTNISYSGSTVTLTGNFGIKAYLTWIGQPEAVVEALIYDASNKPLSKLVYDYKVTSNNSVVTGKNLIGVSRFASTQSGGSQQWSEVSRVSYAYENSARPDLMTGFVDERGVRYSTWTFDSSGRALSSYLATNIDNTSIIYNSSTGIRTVQNSLGRKSDFVYSLINNSLKITGVSSPAAVNTPSSTRSISYDSNGRISFEVDEEGRRVSYTRDSYGRPTSITRGTP